MNCTICNNLLSNERIEGLRFLGKHINQYTCFQCSNLHVKPVSGFYVGLSGVSDLVLTDKVGPIRHLSQEREEIYSEPGELDIDNDDINDRIS